MATDQVLKLTEIEDFFQSIISEMLGLDMTLDVNQDKVRIAWPTSGNPSWEITDDVVFLRITPVDDKQARQLNIAYTPNTTDDVLDKSVGYTRVHKIDITLYGPNSFDNADVIRHLIFSYDYMLKFRAKNLFLITDVPMPQRLPELWNGQWWERTDFTITFNESVIRYTQTPYIESADVVLKSNR